MEEILTHNRCTCILLTTLLVVTGWILGAWYAAAELLSEQQ